MSSNWEGERPPGRRARLIARMRTGFQITVLGITKALFIVRQTTMIAACRPTTRRPFRPSPSPSTWSCSPCGATRSARWSYDGESSRSRGAGRCPAASCAGMRTSPPPRHGNSPRKPGCARTTRPLPASTTGRTSNSSPPTGTRSATPGCGWSAWHTWCSPPTCPHPARAATPTAPAGLRRRTPGRPRPDRHEPRLRPRADPRRRRRAGPLEDRVLLAGHGLLPAGVHRRRAAPGVRGGVGRGARPAQLPPQGHRDPRVPGPRGRDDDPSGRQARPAVQGRRRDPAQPADAAAGSLTRRHRRHRGPRGLRRRFRRGGGGRPGPGCPGRRHCRPSPGPVA